jgi:hypothetical protein
MKKPEVEKLVALFFKLKCAHLGHLNVYIFFVSRLDPRGANAKKIALIETKRITVYGSASSPGKLEAVRNEHILE